MRPSRLRWLARWCALACRPTRRSRWLARRIRTARQRGRLQTAHHHQRGHLSVGLRAGMRSLSDRQGSHLIVGSPVVSDKLLAGPSNRWFVRRRSPLGDRRRGGHLIVGLPIVSEDKQSARLSHCRLARRRGIARQSTGCLSRPRWRGHLFAGLRAIAHPIGDRRAAISSLARWPTRRFGQSVGDGCAERVGAAISPLACAPTRVRLEEHCQSRKGVGGCDFYEI